MRREVIFTITNGKLDFDPWEQIFYYGVFDGCRNKRVLVKIIRTNDRSHYHFCLDNADIMGLLLLPTTSTNSDQVAEET